MLEFEFVHLGMRKRAGVPLETFHLLICHKFPNFRTFEFDLLLRTPAPKFSCCSVRMPFKVWESASQGLTGSEVLSLKVQQFLSFKGRSSN